MIPEVRWWIASAAFLIAFILLGLYVTHHGLSRLDVEAVALRDRSTALAAFFTLSGRTLPLLVLGAIGIGILAFARANIWIGVAILVSEVASQGVAELFKHLFNRPRPDYWLIARELGNSYPSGHAATSVVFYGAWIAVIAAASLPKAVAIPAIVLIAAWCIGIDFSRLALGAHYVTDVIGGSLFGAAWLCAVLAIAAHFNVTVSA
ncbi:MAG: phosphatase PAP2 family protein [Candidatus Eremiobacteraeota bacterium]|nr:phosphatase PAP2 family protein [Candidatus Eremiobacteraeota bacterium]